MNEGPGERGAAPQQAAPAATAEPNYTGQGSLALGGMAFTPAAELELHFEHGGTTPEPEGTSRGSACSRYRACVHARQPGSCLYGIHPCVC